HKNDYSVIVYFENTTPKKWQFVHTLNSFSKFLDSKHPTWKYFNVYERRTGKYLKRFYPGNVVPYFLSLIPIVFVLYFFLTFNNKSCKSTFINGFNNTATISTLLNEKGGVI
ncbi:MAG: hypothetical protein Q8891_16265, partial [Bacteroidota bacterium]|nr:hypothetical protein [Bacteroidota bacterium]